MYDKPNKTAGDYVFYIKPITSSQPRSESRTGCVCFGAADRLESSTLFTKLLGFCNRYTDWEIGPTDTRGPHASTRRARSLSPPVASVRYGRTSGRVGRSSRWSRSQSAWARAIGRSACPFRSLARSQSVRHKLHFFLSNEDCDITTRWASASRRSWSSVRRQKLKKIKCCQ